MKNNLITRCADDTRCDYKSCILLAEKESGV